MTRYDGEKDGTTACVKDAEGEKEGSDVAGAAEGFTEGSRVVDVTDGIRLGAALVGCFEGDDVSIDGRKGIGVGASVSVKHFRVLVSK